MSQFHRFALAYDLLEGDWDARFVLIDLLIEAGDDELVEFARTHKQMNRQGDLELAIRLLPVRQAIWLGCAFLDRGMTGKGNIRRHAWLIARLAQVRRLLRNNAPLAQIAALGRALAGYQVAQPTGRFNDYPIDEGARLLGIALEQVETEGAATPAVAAAARSMRRPRAKESVELEWQVEQTQDVLGGLIACLEPEMAPLGL
jgi:hypothetical protein